MVRYSPALLMEPFLAKVESPSAHVVEALRRQYRRGMLALLAAAAAAIPAGQTFECVPTHVWTAMSQFGAKKARASASQAFDAR